MADNRIIHFIPPVPPKREKRVGIYCHVSTSSADRVIFEQEVLDTADTDNDLMISIIESSGRFRCQPTQVDDSDVFSFFTEVVWSGCIVYKGGHIIDS